MDVDHSLPAEAGRHLVEAFLQLSPDAAVVVDRYGTIRAVNEMAAAMFGYRPAELDDQPVSVLIPESLRHGHERVLRGYTAAPRPRAMGHAGLDLRGRRKDGSEFPVDISLAPVSSGEQETLVVAAIRDVTERLRRERLAARLAAVVQASDAAILSTLPDRTIDSWNPAAGHVFGYAAEEVVGRRLDELVPSDETNEFEAIYGRLGEGERFATTDASRLHRDGSRVPVALSVSAMYDQRGEIIGYCEVLRDMTERRVQQAQLSAALADRQLLAERERIARQLHDTVIHRVFAAGLSINSAQTVVRDPVAVERLGRAVDELDAAVREIRSSLITTQAPRTTHLGS